MHPLAGECKDIRARAEETFEGGDHKHSQVDIDAPNSVNYFWYMALAKFRILRLRLLQHRDFGVGIFP